MFAGGLDAPCGAGEAEQGAPTSQGWRRVPVPTGWDRWDLSREMSQPPQEEAASEVGTTSLPSMSQCEPGLGSAGRHALLGRLSTHETKKHKCMTCGSRWQGGGGGG